ncbi:MAG: SDR family oxidoreductase [Acidobacteriota bacterium]|nr:SDR family oxidoreductase [Blastocatellia bacterium]MDW8413539.1 SDR family oxidoreductase [Acidobacteriota bacterium]
MEIEGKTALVTGGARRIGRAIALALAASGARLIIHYNKSEAEAQEVRGRVLALGGQAIVLKADLAKQQQIESLVCRAQDFGPVDILINNASVYFKTPIENHIAGWEVIMDVNLRAPYLLSTLLGLDMKKRGGGKIVNLADWAANRPYADLIPYCISKAGLVAMTKGLARALGPQVQVNSISPGAVLFESELAEKAQLAQKRTLVDRLGTPADIADAVLYLLRADFVTGIDLVVDGGRTIY